MRAFLFLILLVPAVASAKPPAKKDVDQTVLRMPVEELQALRDAEGKVREGQDALARYTLEEQWAQLDWKAAKEWLDAGKGIIKALEADAASAQAWARIDEQVDLAAQVKRAQANLAWREARFEEAKAFNDFQDARLQWAKAALKHAESEVEHQRMVAYDKKVGGSADAQVEIGKLQQQLGKDATAEGKARQKMEKAEHAWQSAASQSSHLDPNPPKAE
jgi:hypothetical protein